MLLALDGQAHYSTAQIDRKWTLVDTSSADFTIATEGRWSGNPCLKRTATGEGQGSYLRWAPIMTQGGTWTPQTGGVCGFAFKVNDLARLANALTEDHALLTIYEGTALHVLIQLNPDGTLSVYRGYNIVSGLTLLGTSIGAVSNNAWAFLEVKWLIHASAGSVQIRSNGLSIFSYTGQTQSSNAGAYTDKWTSVRLQSFTSTLSPLITWMNDFYLCDLQGSGDQLRDFLSDVRVITLLPTGVGAASGWTPSAGANWAAVDDVPADDDTTYVSTTTAATRDSYTYQDLPVGASPLGFQVCVLATKESEGAATLQPVVRSGGANYDGQGQSVAAAGAYGYRFQPYDTNPATGARATTAEINAAEFGVLRV